MCVLTAAELDAETVPQWLKIAQLLEVSVISCCSIPQMNALWVTLYMHLYIEKGISWGERIASVTVYFY